MMKLVPLRLHLVNRIAGSGRVDTPINTIEAENTLMQLPTVHSASVATPLASGHASPAAGAPQHIALRAAVTVLVALFSLPLPQSAFATVKQGQGGCAKLTTSIQSDGFVTYLQSYGTNCSTPVVRPCQNYPNNYPSQFNAHNDFVVRTHFMHQSPTGGPWTYCLTASSAWASSIVYCASEPLTTNAVEYVQFPVADFGAFLGTYCGPGWYKAVAEGELRTPNEILYLVAESNAVDPSDPCPGGCDDQNACTTDSCQGTTCSHTFAPQCLAPILSLLLDGECGDGIVDAGETCDDGNTVSGDGCSASCRVESCFSCESTPSFCTPIATCANGDGCCPAGCAGNDDDCATPIAGKKLQIRDAADSRKRSVTFVATDLGISTSGINPVSDGAYLQVYNADTGESACLSLPNAGGAWRAAGKPPNLRYTYRDSRYINGPCRLASIKKGRLTATCRATVQPIPYTLDEPEQLSVGVNLTSGAHSFCALFGGAITRDSGTDPPISGGKGWFAAKDAAAPNSCPTPPAACP